MAMVMGVARKLQGRIGTAGYMLMKSSQITFNVYL
jgi:hypothetical protein